MEPVHIYTDTRKLYTIAGGYLILAGIMAGLSFAANDNMLARILCYLLVAFFVVAAGLQIRQATKTAELMSADAKGVTDFSKPDDVVMLPWSQIVHVQLKAAGNNELMLDVFGYKTEDQLPDLTPETRETLRSAGGKAFMSLELSGLWLSHRRMREAFVRIGELAKHYNSQIAVIDYQDPLASKGKKAR